MKTALTSREPVRLSQAVIPHGPGLYGWWLEPSRLSDAAPAIPAVLLTWDKWALLYVGIAPTESSSEGTGRTLVDRISNHRGGNIGSSTFRFSLASLLRSSLGLAPKPGHGRARIVGETALSRWIEEHCRINVDEHARPWDVEDAVIRHLNPPLNIKPGYHEFRTVVKSARETLRRECR